MGRLPRGDRKYNLQQLQSVHREILRRHFLGQKGVQIAEDMGLSEATVSYTINNPLAKEVISGLDEGANENAMDVAARIQEIADDAIEVMAEFVEDAGVPPAIRLRAATDILDRAGHVPVKKIQSQVAHGIFTADDIERIKRQARLGAARARGDQVMECEVVQEAS